MSSRSGIVDALLLGIEALQARLQAKHFMVSTPRSALMVLSPCGNAKHNSALAMANANCPAITNEHKHLGLTVASSNSGRAGLSWSPHVASILRKIAQKAGALRRVARQLSFAARSSFLTHVILPDLDYGNNVFGPLHCLTAADNLALQRAERKAVRAVFNASPTTDIAPLYHELGLLPLNLRWKAKRLTTVYKLVSVLDSTKLSPVASLFQRLPTTHNTRNCRDLIVSKVNKNHLTKSFCY